MLGHYLESFLQYAVDPAVPEPSHMGFGTDYFPKMQEQTRLSVQSSEGDLRLVVSNAGSSNYAKLDMWTENKNIQLVADTPDFKKIAYNALAYERKHNTWFIPQVVSNSNGIDSTTTVKSLWSLLEFEEPTPGSMRERSVELRYLGLRNLGFTEEEAAAMSTQTLSEDAHIVAVIEAMLDSAQHWDLPEISVLIDIVSMTVQAQCQTAPYPRDVFFPARNTPMENLLFTDESAAAYQRGVSKIMSAKLKDFDPPVRDAMLAQYIEDNMPATGTLLLPYSIYADTSGVKETVALLCDFLGDNICRSRTDLEKLWDKFINYIEVVPSS